MYFTHMSYATMQLATIVARIVGLAKYNIYNSLHCSVRNLAEVRTDVNGPAPAVVVAATLHTYLVYGFKLVRLRASD